MDLHLIYKTWKSLQTKKEFKGNKYFHYIHQKTQKKGLWAPHEKQWRLSTSTVMFREIMKGVYFQ